MLTSNELVLCQCTGRVIAEAKQNWSIIGWVTKNLLSRAPVFFGSHVNPLVPVAFAVVGTHQSALCPRGGLMLVLFVSNPQERPLPQQWRHNRLMMM
jgi:hypothetical protein